MQCILFVSVCHYAHLCFIVVASFIISFIAMSDLYVFEYVYDFVHSGVILYKLVQLRAILYQIEQVCVIVYDFVECC